MEGQNARDAIQSLVRRASTAVTMLKDPKGNSWAIYELTRCAIDAIVRSDKELYDWGVELLDKAIEEAVNGRPKT